MSKTPEEETALVVAKNNPPREMLRLVPTESGFDIQIPEGVEPTEAAKTFLETVMRMMKEQREDT